MRAPSALSAALVVAAAACQRVPEEPAAVASTKTTVVIPPPVTGPAPPSAPSASAGQPGTAGRCVRPMAASAPAPVRANPDPRCPPDREPSPPQLPRVDVQFAGVATRVHAELARTARETQRGLMYRRAMAEDAGMFFVMEERREHTFWMHNTCLSLDMMFIDQDGLIVGIVENAPTLDDGVQSVGCPSTYVLEVNAGWSRRHGVRPGQRIVVPPLT